MLRRSERQNFILWRAVWIGFHTDIKKTFNSVKLLEEVMKDLCSSTFSVPVIYNNIVIEIHWHSDTAKHTGVEIVWRHVLKHGYLIQGRDLIKKVKKNYERCRYLRKKAINIEMDPGLTGNLRKASSFMLLKLTYVDHLKHILLTTKEQESKLGLLSVAACLL